MPASRRAEARGEEGVPRIAGRFVFQVHFNAKLEHGAAKPGAEALAKSSQDAVVIVTDHSAVDYELVLRHAPLIVDSRGVYRQPIPSIVRA